MNSTTKFNFLICFFAIVFFAACGNKNPESETTESHIPGDTIKVTDSPERFAVIGISDPKIVNNFVEKVKTALQNNDAAALGAMCIFPLNLNQQDGAAKSKHKEIKDAAEFATDFSKIFSPAMKSAIINQPNSDLFANYQGLMLGNGEVWAQYDAETNALKIFAINVGK
jgi:hypothetical protein